MAKLPGVVEDLSSVEEAFRPLYTEDKEQGHFVLDADVESHPGVHGLKSALAKQKERNQKLAERAKLIEGIEEEELRALLERRKTGDEGDGDDKNKGKDIDAIINKRLAEAEKKFAPVVDENTKLKRELHNLKLDTVLSKVALENGVLKEALTDALDASRRFFQLDDATGKILVLDDDGDPSGMKPEKFFAEKFKTLKPFFYAAKAGSGAGTPPGGGPGGVSADQLANLPPTERIRIARQQRRGA